MKRVRLGDLADVIVSGVDKKTKDGETHVKLCNFVDVYYNWAITDELYDSFMDASARDAEIEKFTIGKGQVAITKDSETRFDIGIPTYIADDFEGVLLGYHCALITPNEELLNGKYLNALLHTDYAKEYFANNATGSGQRYTISEDTIRSFLVPLIPLEEQKKIGDYLSDIDRKIANNRKQNDLFEKMAKQIYDYWFVQFDFPDENGRPYKSSGGKMVWNEQLKREIPEGWEIAKVLECIEPIERGISYSSSDIESAEGLPMLNLACFSKQGEYRTGEMKYFSGRLNEQKKVYPYDMLIACTDMTQGADIIGRPILATEESEYFAYSMDLAKITPKNIKKMYLYYTLRTRSYHKYIKPFASGTTVKHLNISGVENYKLLLPTSELQVRFEDLILDIKRKQMLNINIMQEGKRLRETLLPLLMTGQATIR